MAIPYLPPEILTNIFSRLPLETLSSVRLVNKFWLQLISSQDLARAHLKNSKKDEALSGYRCILTTSSHGCSLKQISVESLCNSTSINLVNLEYHKNGLHRPYARFVGSCNGLVCILLNYKHVVLWNPCTGKYKILPHLDVDEVIPCLCISYGFDDDEPCQCFSYGFGYDESSDDYKVVALYIARDEPFRDGDRFLSVVNVCSLKRNSWERIQDFKGSVGPDMAKLASGRVHWCNCPGWNLNWISDVVCFDLGREEFGIVEQPTYGDGRFQMGFDVLEGCVCLLIGVKETNHMELWLMKEYGVKESWTKVSTISLIPVCERPNRYSSLAVLPNGDVLVFYMDYNIAVYNSKSDSFKSHCINKLDEYLEPVVYFQSLVSPADL